MATYEIHIITEIPDYNGNPKVEKEQYATKALALKTYKMLCKEKHTEHGKSVLVELYKITDEDSDDILLASEYLCPEKIPTGSVIVTYAHIRYLDYCYEVTGVRFANDGETYADLHADKKRTGSPVDKVFESFDNLDYEYNSGHGIFGKLQRGYSIIEEFLNSPYND